MNRNQSNHEACDSGRYLPEIRHSELGAEFYDVVSAAIFPKLTLRFRNQRWANRMGLGHLGSDQWRNHFGLFQSLPKNLQQPLALRYHGHQFMHYNPDLGDGRGFLFAQMRDPQNGKLLDLGTKGSGQTPWSRAGDGRLTLKGAVREVLATEMLEALGVPTSKTWSVFETGESLERNDEPSPTRAAVLVRLNHSHIRFGTFQRFAYELDKVNLEKLLRYSAGVYYPDLILPSGAPVTDASAQELSVEFLKAVSRAKAQTVASWMAAGFVHGVLNTDNMNITGESFDYGPYRFLPKFDPNFTAAYFDHQKLYSYGRQPEQVFWNLQQLAACLTLLAEQDSLEEALSTYAPEFNQQFRAKFFRRLGLEVSADEKLNSQVLVDSFHFLKESDLVFPEFFRRHFQGENLPESLQAHRLPKISWMQPAPQCSLLIDEIESIWSLIDRNDDWTKFEQKVAAIREFGKVTGLSTWKDSDESNDLSADFAP